MTLAVRMKRRVTKKKAITKGKKAIEEAAKRGRARPLIISISPDTAKKLNKILSYPDKFKGIDTAESDDSETIDYWEPCWLEVIYELASRYATEEEIVAYLPYTMNRWQKLKNDPSTRVRDVLTAARADGLMFLKNKFRSKVDEGDTRAIIFGLRSQAGWREDGMGTEGADRGSNRGALTGTVDRLLAKCEATRQ